MFAHVLSFDYQVVLVLLAEIWNGMDSCEQVFDIVCVKESNVPTHSRACAKQINVVTFSPSPVYSLSLSLSHTQIWLNSAKPTAQQTIIQLHVLHTQVCVSMRLSPAQHCPNQSERGRCGETCCLLDESPPPIMHGLIRINECTVLHPAYMQEEKQNMTAAMLAQSVKNEDTCSIMSNLKYHFWSLWLSFSPS